MTTLWPIVNTGVARMRRRMEKMMKRSVRKQPVIQVLRALEVAVRVGLYGNVGRTVVIMN